MGRRQFLVALGVAGVVGLSACSGNGGHLLGPVLRPGHEFLPKGAPNAEGAKDWLRLVGWVEGQQAFNIVKGSIPARTDVPDTEFPEYQEGAMKSFKEDRIASSIAHGAATNNAGNPEVGTAIRSSGPTRTRPVWWPDSSRPPRTTTSGPVRPGTLTHRGVRGARPLGLPRICHAQSEGLGFGAAAREGGDRGGGLPFDLPLPDGRVLHRVRHRVARGRCSPRRWCARSSCRSRPGIRGDPDLAVHERVERLPLHPVPHQPEHRPGDPRAHGTGQRPEPGLRADHGGRAHRVAADAAGPHRAGQVLHPWTHERRP